MTGRELLRRLRKVGAVAIADRGKGGHVMVRRGKLTSVVPIGSGEIPTGTLLAILKQLGVRRDEI